MFFEQVSHLIRRESLHKPRFRLHMMLTAVVELQLMKSSEQALRAIVSDQSLYTGLLNQPQVGANLIPT